MGGFSVVACGVRCLFSTPYLLQHNFMKIHSEYSRAQEFMHSVYADLYLFFVVMTDGLADHESTLIIDGTGLGHLRALMLQLQSRFECEITLVSIGMLSFSLPKGCFSWHSKQQVTRG